MSRAIQRYRDEKLANFVGKNKRSYQWRTNDELLVSYALGKTMGEMVYTSEVAQKAREYTLSRMICNAVFEADVELIQTLVTRIDGTIPAEGNQGNYATAFGDAIDEVLEMDIGDQMNVLPEDTPILAMAKAVIFTATNRVGANVAKRKERNLATKMILERTGGRKTSPTPLQIETVYVQPDWMGLPEGGEQSEHRNEDGTD